MYFLYSLQAFETKHYFLTWKCEGCNHLLLQHGNTDTLLNKYWIYKTECSSMVGHCRHEPVNCMVKGRNSSSAPHFDAVSGGGYLCLPLSRRLTWKILWFGQLSHTKTCTIKVLQTALKFYFSKWLNRLGLNCLGWILNLNGKGHSWLQWICLAV